MLSGFTARAAAAGHGGKSFLLLFWRKLTRHRHPPLSNLGEASSNPRNALPTFVFSTSASATSFAINTDTLLYYSAGQTPVLQVSSLNGAVGELFCTLTGYSLPSPT